MLEALRNRQYGTAGTGPLYGAIVPVPMHRSRLAERQYNQAALLAREVSQHTSVPVVSALTKTSQPPPQASLDRECRMVVLRDAFRSLARGASPVKNTRVLLVDDVFTTGATAHACSRVLLDMGAEAVDVAVIAAGLPGHGR
jgi:predicted amidophosphoribosyltransferase